MSYTGPIVAKILFNLHFQNYPSNTLYSTTLLALVAHSDEPYPILNKAPGCIQCQHNSITVPLLFLLSMLSLENVKRKLSLMKLLLKHYLFVIYLVNFQILMVGVPSD